MSADAQKTVSKAAKKNKKRNSKKVTEQSSESSNDSSNPEIMLIELKKLLDEAKLNKDHARAASLRDQIWVLTDLVNGVKTKIPEEDLEKILESIQSHFRQKTSNEDRDVADTEHASPANQRLVPSAAVSVSPTSAVLDDRKLKNLRKKLEQIEDLKERQKKGEKLEANQVEKIKSEKQVKEEIKELEDLLRSLLKV